MKPHKFEVRKGEGIGAHVWCVHCNATRDEIPGMHNPALNKQARHAAIRERAAAAIRDLYHNATPDYPRLDEKLGERFEGWFRDTVESEIDYLRDGGATPGDYRKTLAADCNAGKYKSARARAYYIAKGMRDRDEERTDCGALTGWRALEIAAGNAKLARQLARTFKGAKLTRNNALWERISDYGKLYQYGRGGRTLAAEDLVRTRGGSGFSLREDYADERAGFSIASTVELIRTLESFNRYVAAWCEGVPAMWAEWWTEEQREERRAARNANIDAQVRRAFQ